MRVIAQHLCRASSTVSREAARQGGRAQYRANEADSQASQAASQGKIVDAISIRERPAEAEDRAIPGHWEGDLLRGSRNSHVAKLVKCHSRFRTLVKGSGKDTARVVGALSQHVRDLPLTLRRSLARDGGLEMAQHKSFTMTTDVQVYFCDPQSPWQRGSNENTYGLLQQYLSKKSDLSCYSQSELDEIALRLNQRPRKTFEFQTPADQLQVSVASNPWEHPAYGNAAISCRSAMGHILAPRCDGVA